MIELGHSRFSLKSGLTNGWENVARVIWLGGIGAFILLPDFASEYFCYEHAHEV